MNPKPELAIYYAKRYGYVVALSRETMSCSVRKLTPAETTSLARSTGQIVNLAFSPAVDTLLLLAAYMTEYAAELKILAAGKDKAPLLHAIETRLKPRLAQLNGNGTGNAVSLLVSPSLDEMISDATAELGQVN